jgi:ribosome maturation factor RimP
MQLERKIAELIDPAIADLGFDLVRVQIGGGKSRPTLQVMAEPITPRTMTLDDCTLLSQQISALLDVHDALLSSYVLEVSSPGIDRPLTRAKDFEQWSGHEALIETHDRIDNRARFRGAFEVSGNAITLTQDGRTYTIPMSDIRKAKLVLTDALIKAAQDLIPPTEEPEPTTEHVEQQGAA